MTKQGKKPFNKRAFWALLAAFSGVALPITGLADHLANDQPITVDRHPWMATHFGLGIIFTGAVTFHVVLNRRLLLKYIHGLAACLPSLSREAIWAAVLVAITVVVAIGHPYVGK